MFKISSYLKRKRIEEFEFGLTSHGNATRLSVMNRSTSIMTASSRATPLPSTTDFLGSFRESSHPTYAATTALKKRVRPVRGSNASEGWATVTVLRSPLGCHSHDSYPEPSMATSSSSSVCTLKVERQPLPIGDSGSSSA